MIKRKGKYNMKKGFGLILLVSGILMFSYNAFSQEEPLDEQFTFGNVVSASSEKLVLKEYNFDEDKEEEITYSIDAKTQYENASSFSDLAADDEVEVYFKEEKEERTATLITKYELSEEDMEDPDLMNSQEDTDGAE